VPPEKHIPPPDFQVQRESGRYYKFDYEWNFGASFGWKKYDGLYNPQNEVIGSKINAYPLVIK